MIFGIDLGTTFSVISYYDPTTTRVEIIPDQDTSQSTVPSAVYFPPGGGVAVVGATALNMSAQDPNNLVQWIKMSIGTDYRRVFNGCEHTPETISAEILKRLKANAETYTGEQVTDVVVTVPAYFGDAERNATCEAIRLAGLNLKGNLLPEPSAAALAYAIGNIGEIADKRILVYDLGGGTFDVTLMETRLRADHGGKTSVDIRTLCKDGSRELGGKLWDDRLKDYLAEESISKFGTNPKETAISELMLNDRVIAAKHQLSRVDSYDVVVDAKGNVVNVTKEKFEEITRSLLLETKLKIEDVLSQAERQGIRKSEIDVILLAGGATRMPAVKAILTEMFQREPSIHKNVDLVVSMGAAYNAYILSGELVVTDEKTGAKIAITSGNTFTDIGRAIGIKAYITEGGREIARNHIVIPENSAFDTDFTIDKIVTHEDGQVEVEFQVNEGNSEILEDCREIGRAILSGLPPKRPRGRPLKAMLKYDRNGIIVGKGLDVETGKEVGIHIERNKISLNR